MKSQFAMGISGVVRGISIAFKPIVCFLSLSTNFVLRLCGIDPNETEDQVSEEEIRMMVDAGSEKGTIDDQEKKFIQNVFEFDDTFVKDIATHRTDVLVLCLEDDLRVWAETIHGSRHTLYPVCDGSPDNIIGILNAKDYFRLPGQAKEDVLSHAVHPAYFVPENIKADMLFRNMKKTRNSMAVIMDEHGGMVGVITMFDLIEELVGKLENEHGDAQSSEPYLERITENTWNIRGNIELNELETALGVKIASEECETLTGLVFGVLGSVPNEGEQSIDLEIQNLQIHVTGIWEHQIHSATVTLKEQSSPPDSESDTAVRNQ